MERGLGGLNFHNLHPEAPKLRQSRAQELPREPQGSPKSSQDDPKRAQRRPRAAKRGPRPSQERPKSSQEASRSGFQKGPHFIIVFSTLFRRFSSYFFNGFWYHFVDISVGMLLPLIYENIDFYVGFLESKLISHFL